MQLGVSKCGFCPWATNIQLKFTSLSNLALNIEHCVCEVSSAQPTEALVSALFEALDGLELHVNNYLSTLPTGLPVATNAFAITSTGVLLQSPFHITTKWGAQNRGAANGDPVCNHTAFPFKHLPLCCQSCGGNRAGFLSTFRLFDFF